MGAVWNSESEFNRCYIPRLRVVDNEEISEMEEKVAEEVEEGIREEVNLWDERKSKVKKTGRFRKTGASKHGRRESQEDGGKRVAKKRKHSLILNWGEEKEVKTTYCERKMTGEPVSNKVPGFEIMENDKDDGGASLIPTLEHLFPISLIEPTD